MTNHTQARKQLVRSLLVSGLSFFVIAGAAGATTTINANLNTGGTLDVTGATTLTGAVTFTAAGSVKSTTSSSMTVDSGTTGSVLLGTGSGAKTITIGAGSDDAFSINSSGLIVSAAGALTGVASINGVTSSSTAFGFGGAGTVSTGAGTNLTLDSGTTGSVLLGAGAGAKTITIGAGSDDTFSLSSNGLVVSSTGDLTGVDSVDTVGVTATAISFAGAGSVTSGAGTDLTLDSGTTGSVLIGTGVAAKTITIGNGTNDTLSIASSAFNVSSTGAVTGVTDFATTGSTQSLGNAATDSLTITAAIQGTIKLDGTTDNADVLTLTAVDPTSAQSQSFQNNSGTIPLGNFSDVFLSSGDASVTIPTSGTLVASVATANGVSAVNTDSALTFTLGAITPTTVNGNTFTTGSSTYTGTAGQTYTFPTTTASIARTDAGQTFTGTQAFGAVTATTVNGNTLTTGSSTYTGTAGQTYTFPTTSASIARTDAANIFESAASTNNFLATSGTAPLKVSSATANDDAMQFLPVAGGGAHFTATFTTPDLVGDVTITLPGKTSTVAVLDQTENFTAQNTFSGRLILGRQTLTLVTAGAGTETLTPTSPYVEVAGSDDPGDIVTISTTGAVEGQILLITNTDAVDIKIDQAISAKLSAGADVTLTQFDVMELIYDGSNWLQVAGVTANS